jgi:peptide/nickel transport system permease protein
VYVYVLKRILLSLVTLCGVTAIVFVIVNAAGDPIELMLSSSSVTRQEIEQMRRELGYDRPALERFAHQVSGMVRGDLGLSLRFRRPVIDLVAERFPATVQLALGAIAVAILVGLPAGIIAATRPGGVVDRLVMMVALVGQSIPLFWLGIVLIQLAVVQLRLLPVGGRGGGDLAYMLLPAITLGTFPMARIARLVRSSMLEALGQDYIATARAKGASELRVNYLHALRNAALVIVTVIGLQIGTLLGGAVVTEAVFAWPGLGQLSVQAAQNRDMPLVQGIVLLAATVFITINLLVDLLYAVLDPRIRYST